MLDLAVRESKYHNKKVCGIDGLKFDSKKEAKRYWELKMLERAGLISDLKTQVPYTLIDKSEYGREIKYLADFVYYDVGSQKIIVEDTKGFRTDIYKLKKRLLSERYGIIIKET